MWGRIWQTLQALSAWIRPADDQLAANYLSPDEYALFLTMKRSDRQHHLRVLRRILAASHNQSALLVAALLHDVGKTHIPFTIPDRIIAVLVKRLFPRRFERWSQNEPNFWNRALVISAQHPEWGAEMLAEIQADPLAIDLVRYHQDNLMDVPQDEEFRALLSILQAADDAS